MSNARAAARNMSLAALCRCAVGLIVLVGCDTSHESASRRGPDQQVPVARGPAEAATGAQHAPRVERLAPLYDPEIFHRATKAGIGELRFYGRIFDQSNQPVAGAKVSTLVTLVEATVPILSDQVLTTDDQGRFHFDGYLGNCIWLNNLDLPSGCLNLPLPEWEKQKEFHKFYCLYGEGHNYKPDPAKPVVLHVYRKALKPEPLLRLDLYMDGIKSDGRPSAFSLFTGKLVDSDKGQADFRISFHSQPANDGSRFIDWSATLEAIDGGFVNLVTNERNGWIAPKEGYTSSITWSCKTGDAPDPSNFQRAAYFRSRGGQVYGILTLIAPKLNTSTRDSWTLTLKGILNPNCSRNLEGEIFNEFDTMAELEAQKKHLEQREKEFLRGLRRWAEQEQDRKHILDASQLAVRKPIHATPFFGLVRDQDHNPVEGVDVELSGRSANSETQFTHRSKSDEEGRFEFHDTLRERYTLSTIKKEGYLATLERENGLSRSIDLTTEDVEFGLESKKGLGTSPKKPWVFHLWKIEAPRVPLVVAVERRDFGAIGRPLFIDLDDLKRLDVKPEGAALRLIVTPSVRGHMAKEMPVSDWYLTVEAINGGIDEAAPDDPFMYRAPEHRAIAPCWVN